MHQSSCDVPFPCDVHAREYICAHAHLHAHAKKKQLKCKNQRQKNTCSFWKMRQK